MGLQFSILCGLKVKEAGMGLKGEMCGWRREQTLIFPSLYSHD